MKTLVIGATGYVGSAICRTFAKNGATVTGLARSDANERDLAAAGVESVRATLAAGAELTALVADFDTVVFTPLLALEAEKDIVDAIIRGMAARKGALLYMSGTGVMGQRNTDGTWSEDSFGETDAFVPPPWMEPRIATENLVRSAQNIRGMVIRPPLIWGHGGSKQIPALFDSAALTGAVCYLGAGLNLYSNVHVDDLAELYWLAAQHGVAGSVYHAIAGEANFRAIAEAAASVIGCPTRSVSLEEAHEIWGEEFVTIALAVNSRARAPLTRETLSWAPRHLDVIEDIRNGSYAQHYRREMEQGGFAVGGESPSSQNIKLRYRHESVER
ncbi:NAD-dependent epimerase/dehydratase family protein [Pectobacterium betavasculorum]|uniref:NAD-dependent epimerase/dehydratase family protein n=1 Tax=Pectobacterium betavasculorum TaxID=55207 RepID=UPI00313F2B08